MFQLVSLLFPGKLISNSIELQEQNISTQQQMPFHNLHLCKHLTMFPGEANITTTYNNDDDDDILFC